MTLKNLVANAHPNVGHLHNELPYRYYNEDTELFENQNSIGFGKKISVLGGASKEIVTSLNSLICRLPEGKKWDYQFCLTGNNQVGHMIDSNTKRASARGGMAATIAENQAIYAHHAAKHGFGTRLGSAYRFDLKHYQAFFFCTSTAKEEDVLDLKTTLDYGFVQAGIDHAHLDAPQLIDFVSQSLNFNGAQIYPKQATYNEDEHLHTQMIELDSEFLIHRNYVESRATFAEQSKPAHTRILQFSLRKLPASFQLGQMANCLASLTNQSNALRCPFKITCNFKIEDTGKQHVLNESKIQSLSKWVNSPMRIFLPTIEKELDERTALRDGFLRDEYKIASMIFTLTLYTNEENMKADRESALGVFKGAGLELVSTDMIHGQTLLSGLPFSMIEYFDDCKKAGRARMLKTSNLVNFFPIVGEYRRLDGGLLLPTMRHQINYFDMFNCGTDNQNMAITGSSGGGKSFLVQNIVNSVYSRGGKVWILDKGDSYKKLTQTMGGVYLNAAQIRLSPFTHIAAAEAKQGTTLAEAAASESQRKEGDEKDVNPLATLLGDLTGLFASIAAPNSDLNDYQENMLGDAILRAWTANRQDTLIDHVQDALYAIAKERDNDRRISDLAAQLNKYCTKGIYGKIFNEPSQLDPNVHITTIELEGFSDNVLRPVVFALMVTINQAMYLSGDRKTPKLCVIEEAWSLMSGNNRQSRAFIDKGYRTARKFGGSFACVTQGISDFFKSPEAEAAYNNSDIKMILRQGSDFDKFVKENPTAFDRHVVALIKDFQTAKIAGFSSVMVNAGNTITFHRLFADPWSRALFSTEPVEYEYCETLIHQGVPLDEAVNKTAWHFYPTEMQSFEALKTQYYSDKNERYEQV